MTFVECVGYKAGLKAAIEDGGKVPAGEGLGKCPLCKIDIRVENGSNGEIMATYTDPDAEEKCHNTKGNTS